jgi:hypothetical protein
MKTDDFEQRLQRQAQREIPAAWRAGILAKAQGCVALVQTARTPRPGLFCLIQTLFSRPQRMAWAGLAAAWVVIITLHLATGETSKTISISAASSPVTPETLQVLKQQRLLYAELVGHPEPRPINRSKTFIPGPRSQRREETATV